MCVVVVLFVCVLLKCCFSLSVPVVDCCLLLGAFVCVVLCCLCLLCCFMCVVLLFVLLLFV